MSSFGLHILLNGQITNNILCEVGELQDYSSSRTYTLTHARTHTYAHKSKLQFSYLYTYQNLIILLCRVNIMLPVIFFLN
jgi:hypothetical protein